MKKITFMLFLLCVLKVNAQEAVMFKMKYLPNHTYAATVGMNMNFNVTLSGNEELINKLKSQGITQPLAATLAMNMSGNTITGAPGADNNFPLTMNFKFDQFNVNFNGKSIPIPMNGNMNTGTAIYGHVGPDGKLKADSVGGSKIKDTTEKKISLLMNTIQNMVKFPDYPLHTGDTFTQEMPMNIPMADNNSEASIKVIYKLVSISGDNAFFDVSQSIDFKINVKQVSLNLKGTGTGKFIYSIKNNFPTDFSSKMNLKFDGQVSTMTIGGTALMDSDYKYVIN